MFMIGLGTLRRVSTAVLIIMWAATALAAEPHAVAVSLVATAPDTPVAVVNGMAITRAQFDRRMRAFLRRFGTGRHDAMKPDDIRVKDDVLGRMVDGLLLYQEGQRHSLHGLEEAIDQRETSLKARLGTDDAFRRMLDGEGLTLDTFRETIRREVTAKLYIEQVLLAKLTVEEDETKQIYENRIKSYEVPEKVRVGQIFLKVPPGASAEEKQQVHSQAAELHRRIAGGESFEALALEYSDDPDSASKGGDLGFTTQRDLWAPLATPAFQLGVGEVSEVIETGMGYHILKVSDRLPAQAKPFEEVRSQIEDFVRQEQSKKAVRDEIAQLRAKMELSVVPAHLGEEERESTP